MTAAVRDIVNGALELVGQVAGSGVQVYADDFGRQCAARAFDMLFKKRDWEHYLEWTKPELDGVTGIIKEDLYEPIRDFEDFLAVYRDGTSKPLPVMDHKHNKFKLTGSRVQTWTSLNVTHPLYAKRKLQFYPLESEGFVNVLVRKYPLPSPAIQWGWSDIMHLDRSMMEEATAFVMLSVDAINADAANVCKSMMEARYIDIVAALGARPMHIRGTSDIPDQWYVTR
jgi:hypothetical protein